MTPCDGCGSATTTRTHRRLPETLGGRNTHPNLFNACDTCHDKAHTLLGEQLGWTLRAGNDPAMVPVFRLSDEVWRRDGVVINPNDAVEYLVLVGQIASGLSNEGGMNGYRR